VNQNEFSRLLNEGAAELGLSLPGEQIMAFFQYLQELKAWGRRINLTSRHDDREVIVKDFLDSLTVQKYLFPGASLLDLGSGAGFPGVPLRIIRPDLKVVLLEATRKKVYFLKNLVRLLGLEGIEVHWAEKDGSERRFVGEFEFVISRAFGSILKFWACGLPFLKRDGILLAMKGKKGDEELKKNLPELGQMGLKLAFVDRLRLPFLGHERILFGFKHS